MEKTEMLIVEDLMLLLLDDESGAISGEATLDYPLGGAVLAELALTGKVEAYGTDRTLYGPKVHAVMGDPPSDPLLHAAYDTIAERPRGVQTLLIEIGAGLRHQVLDRLIERKLLRCETKRSFGIFRTTTLPANDLRYEAALLESVRAVLEDGAEPDNRTAALVAVLSSTGTLPEFDPAIRWSSKVHTRSKELEQGNWSTEAVHIAMTQNDAAIAVGSARATSTTLI